jgi:hypothetical protein
VSTGCARRADERAAAPRADQACRCRARRITSGIAIALARREASRLTGSLAFTRGIAESGRGRTADACHVSASAGRASTNGQREGLDR